MRAERRAEARSGSPTPAARRGCRWPARRPGPASAGRRRSPRRSRRAGGGTAAGRLVVLGDARSTAAGRTPRPSPRTSSSSSSKSAKSDTTCSTPCRFGRSRRRCRPARRAAAVSVGVGSPRLGAVVDGARRGEAERAGLAPPRRRCGPSRRSRRRVAGSRLAPRSPITYRRSAPCGTCAPTSMSCGRRSSASRYSAKRSHSQLRPSCSAAPGMSSTPSISSIRRSRSCAPHRREARRRSCP